MPEVITIAGWRAEALERELATMWEFGAERLNNAACYWLADVQWLITSAREIPPALPSMPRTFLFA